MNQFCWSGVLVWRRGQLRMAGKWWQRVLAVTYLGGRSSSFMLDAMLKAFVEG
jgi:hypothetical protein